jgi:hypothetical protein
LAAAALPPRPRARLQGSLSYQGAACKF